MTTGPGHLMYGAAIREAIARGNAEEMKAFALVGERMLADSNLSSSDKDDLRAAHAALLSALNASPKKVVVDKKMIDEITSTIKAMEGKELEQGRLTDLAPGISTAWYIAYST